MDMKKLFEKQTDSEKLLADSRFLEMTKKITELKEQVTLLESKLNTVVATLNTVIKNAEQSRGAETKMFQFINHKISQLSGKSIDEIKDELNAF